MMADTHGVYYLQIGIPEWQLSFRFAEQVISLEKVHGSGVIGQGSGGHFTCNGADTWMAFSLNISRCQLDPPSHDVL
jgi:hypothetical protein